MDHRIVLTVKRFHLKNTTKSYGARPSSLEFLLDKDQNEKLFIYENNFNAINKSVISNGNRITLILSLSGNKQDVYQTNQDAEIVVEYKTGIYVNEL